MLQLLLLSGQDFVYFQIQNDQKFKLKGTNNLIIVRIKSGFILNKSPENKTIDVTK